METTPEQVVEGKALVTVLTCVLEKLIQANSNSGRDRLEEEAVTKFNALRPPGIGVAEYLNRILKYSSCSNECFVLGLIYMVRFLRRKNFALTALNVHRVSITSIMVAAKFLDDQHYDNAYYAKVGGIPLTEMNALEVEFLFGLDFNLAVTAEEYGSYREVLSEHANCSTCGCAARMLVKQQRPSPPLPPSSRLSETGRIDGGSASSGPVVQGSASGWPKPRDGYDELALTAGDLNQARDGPDSITPAAVLGNAQSSIARGARGLGGVIVQGKGGGSSGLCAPVGTGRGDSGVGAVHRGGFDPDAASVLGRELQQQQQQQQQQLLLEQETTGAEALLSTGGVIESNVYGGDGTTRQRTAQQQQYDPQREDEQQRQQEHEQQLPYRQTRGKFPAAHSSGASKMDGTSGVMPMQEVCSSAMGSVAQGMTLSSRRFRITPSPEDVHPFQGSSSSGVGLSIASVSGGTRDSRGGASACGATEPTSSVFGNLSLQRMASAGGVAGFMSSNLCSNGGGSSSGFPLPTGHARRRSTRGAFGRQGNGDLSPTLAAAAAATGTSRHGGHVGGGFVGCSGGRGGITGKVEGASCMPLPHGVFDGWGAVGGGGEPLGNILFEKQEQQQQQRYRSGQKQCHENQQQLNHLGLSSNALQEVHTSFAGGRASASSPAGPPERGHYSAGAYAASPTRYRETAGGGKAIRDGLIRDTVVNGNHLGDVGSEVGVGGRLSNHNESEQTTSNLFYHRFPGSSYSGEGVGDVVPAWHDIHSGRDHRPRNASGSCGNFPMKSRAVPAFGNVSISRGRQRFRITPSPEGVHLFQGSSSSGVGQSMASVSGGTGHSGGGASACGATEPTSSVFGNLSLQRMASAGGVAGSMSSNLCSIGGGSSSSSGFRYARRESSGPGRGDLSDTLPVAAAATGSAGHGGDASGGFVGFSGGRGGITGKVEGASCMPLPHGVFDGWGAVGGGGEPLGNILFEKQEQQQQQMPFQRQQQQQQRYRSGQKQCHENQQQLNHLGLASNALQEVHTSFAGGRESASSPAGPPERGHYSAGAYAASPTRYRETAGGGKAIRDGLIRDTVVNGNHLGDVGSEVGVGGRLSNYNESGQTTSNLFYHRFPGSSYSGEGVGDIVPAWHDIHSVLEHRPRTASASYGNFPMKSCGGSNGGVGFGLSGLIMGHGGFLERECLEARKHVENGSFVSTSPSVGTKGGGGYLKSTPGSGIGGVGGSGCGAGGRAGRGGSKF